MKVWTFFRWTVVAGVMAAPLGLLAQESSPNPKDPAQLFAELDKNGDGKLKAEEIAAAQRRFFEHLLRVAGKEKDGELTKDEFLKGFQPDDLKVAAPQNIGGFGSGNRPDPAQIFQRFDANKDGKLGLNEIPAQARPRFQQIFDRLDKQELTRDEFVRAMGRFSSGSPETRQSPFFRLLDANGDGRLSKEELQKAAEFFEELDVNKDGFLDPSELFGAPAGAPASGSNERAEMQMPEIKAGKSNRPSAGGTGEANADIGKGAGQRQDSDGDGKISRSEARGRLKQNFDSIDKNGDGYLDRNEIRSALQQAKGK